VTYIIFDLEWVATFYKGQLPEVISIGAVKLEERDGRLVETGRFNAYVRPQKAKNLNKRTIKITGIKPQDILAQDDFSKVWRRFVKWFGEREYYLLTWGSEDVRTLIKNCRQHRMPLEWLRNYNDLQGEFGRLYGQKNQSGLLVALEMLAIPPLGQHHSAVDDARNTAAIFRAIYDRLQLERNHHLQVTKKFGPKDKDKRRMTSKRPAGARTGTGTRTGAATRSSVKRPRPVRTSAARG